MQTVVSAHALLGEGPLWLPDEQRLYWLDIEGRKLHRFDPTTGHDETFSTITKVGCIVPCENGNFLLAGANGVEEVRISGDRIETIAVLAHPEAEVSGNRYNDGKCSPEGRFFFGSLNTKRQAEASLYVLDEHGCRTVITGATNSNGLGWSLDGRSFYWIDTPTRRIEAFDYDPLRGELSNRRTAFAFPGKDGTEITEWGRPDGMTVDAEGMIWVAHWMGGRVTRWNPATGTLLETVRLPVSRISSVTFGGPDLDTLYITTACKDMSPEEKQREPEAGNLFAVRTSAIGLPPTRFRC